MSFQASQGTSKMASWLKVFAFAIQFPEPKIRWKERTEVELSSDLHLTSSLSSQRERGGGTRWLSR